MFKCVRIFPVGYANRGVDGWVSMYLQFMQIDKNCTILWTTPYLEILESRESRVFLSTRKKCEIPSSCILNYEAAGSLSSRFQQTLIREERWQAV